MPGYMAFKNGIIVSICFILAILVSCRYLDHAIALYFRDLILTNRQLTRYVSDIPDLLLLAVVIITVLFWAAYGYHALKRSHDARMSFFLDAGCAVPAAFVLKVVLKYVFGRVNTRFWLHNQNVEEFHWFDGGHNYSGFPSGHMAVVAALIVSLWFYYPRYRPAYLGLLLLSGGALIATDYHFLGDVIAGGYLGLLVNSGVRRCLSFRDRDKGETMSSLLIVPLLLVALAFTPLQAAAADNPSFREANSEYALLAGYGITHRGFGETRSQVQTFDAILRYGHFLSDDWGEGWYRGRHELLLELPLHLAVDRDARTMTGGYILGSWKFTTLRDFVPYLFAGGGILYVDLGLPTMGSRLDFSYQGGTGLQYFPGGNIALNLEYRYHHVSNADTATPNEPLNSSKVLVGISIFR